MDVSVIIPAYNNPGYVSLMLRSLCMQKTSCQWEIVLVDDSESEVMKDFEKLNILNLKVIEIEHSGRAVARNTGVMNSRGKYLVFMDSDMIADEYFIENHFMAHENQKNTVVLGKVNHIPREYFDEVKSLVNANKISELNRYVTNDNYLCLGEKVFVDKQIENYIGWICCLFSNCSVSREAVIKSGLFDTDFWGWGLEDIELGYRLFLSNMTYVYRPSIANYHVDHESNKDNMLIDMARNLKKMYKKHPDNAVKNYKSFVAGFMDLSTLYKEISGSVNGYEEGENFFFKPLDYALSKA